MYTTSFNLQEKFEDTKEISRSRKSTDRRTDNAMIKGKRTKGQTMMYKTLHSKQKIPLKPEVNSGVPEG